MLALSWKNPYAMLMLCGKDETRTWATNVRGPILMCASIASYNNPTVLKISGPIQMTRLYIAITTGLAARMQEQSFDGHAFAVGKLVDCVPMTPEDEDKCFVQYREGLFRHVYENVRPIQPIPWKGTQGWKTVPPEILEQIIYLD